MARAQLGPRNHYDPRQWQCGTGMQVGLIWVMRTLKLCIAFTLLWCNISYCWFNIITKSMYELVNNQNNNQFIVTHSVIHVQTTGIIQYWCATQEKRHVEVLAYIMTQLRYFRKYRWVKKAYLYTYIYTYIFTTCWCDYISMGAELHVFIGSINILMGRLLVSPKERGPRWWGYLIWALNV